MNECQEHLAELWRWKVGMPEYPRDYESLKRSEWSVKFERLMRNRLIMGALRYGPLGEPGKPRFDRLGAIAERLDRYQESGNDELLVDIANLALLEFVEGRHSKKHFSASDDGEHVQIRTYSRGAVNDGSVEKGK